jgi:hypothetical protein
VHKGSGATGDASGTERAVTSHDGVGVHVPTSDWGARLKWVLGCWPVGRPDLELFFPILKSSQTCKFKYTAFSWSTIIQTCDEASFEHIEQVSQLGQLQIPNRSHVINFGTKSTLIFSSIF